MTLEDGSSKVEGLLVCEDSAEPPGDTEHYMARRALTRERVKLSFMTDPHSRKPIKEFRNKSFMEGIWLYHLYSLSSPIMLLTWRLGF
jgi:hypothetical protein